MTSYIKGDDFMYSALELDLLEALDLSIRQPLLYFQLRIRPHISINTLSKGVSQCIQLQL